MSSAHGSSPSRERVVNSYLFCQIVSIDKDGNRIPVKQPPRDGTTLGASIEITKNLERDQALSHFPAIDGFAKHHMIPISVAEKFPVMRLAARDSNYNINRTQNLIHLPKTRELAITSNLPLHTGDHLDTYYDYVTKALGVLQKDFDRGNIKKADLLTAIEKIEKTIEYRLVNRQIKLQTNDPHY